MMKRRIILAISAAAVTAGVYGFINIGMWLAAGSPLPKTADFIFVFAGEPERIAYAADLAGEYSNAVLVCSEYEAGRLLRTGRNSNAETNGALEIHIMPLCSSTYDEIQYLKKLLAQEHRHDNEIQNSGLPAGSGNNVILVSSPFHMRRIRLMSSLSLKIPENRARIYHAPVPFNRYAGGKNEYKRWWKYPEIREKVFSELLKMAYYITVSLNPFVNEAKIREKLREPPQIPAS